MSSSVAVPRAGWIRSRRTDAPVPRLTGREQTHSFTELAKRVRDAGLQGRTRWFYLSVTGGLALALGGVVTGMVLLGHSWLQLLMAGALGVILTQLAFLGHEASHRQIFTSGPANDRFGRLLSAVVGISHQWWMHKHGRHHANPNKVAKDPDIGVDTVSFLEEDAEQRTGVLAWITRHQGTLFFPLLLLEGVNLHRLSVNGLVGKNFTRRSGVELAVLVARLAAYAGIVFWVLPLGLAFAFLGVQLAVFGLYMGASFAPNHTGMPIVAKDAKLDFLTKQVRTSRNITGGWWMTALMGGLNHQVEHHLFPNMPRPHLSRARTMVREHCREHGIAYAETSLPAAYGIVLRHMNRVGLAAAKPFDCPVSQRMGR